MGDNNKKYSGFGYVVNPTRMWYNKYYVCITAINLEDNSMILGRSVFPLIN